jgi:phage terminase large subunit
MARFASEQWGYSSGQPGIIYGDNTSKMYASTIEVDPSAASFILQLQRDGLHKARAADNDVLGGIRKIAAMVSNGDLIIDSEKCPVLVSEMETYAWDQSAADRGEDKPQKIDDHAVDALKYAVNSI